MIQVACSPSFRRAYKRRIEGRFDLEAQFTRSLRLFIENPHHPRLRTHKLSGALAQLWSFTVQYDCRVIFYFADGHRAVLVDIGKHDEVY